MILPRSHASYLLLGAVVALVSTSASVEAGDDADRVLVKRVANRCAQFGPGFVDLGTGICGRVSNQLRVYVYGGSKSVSMTSTQTTISNNWSTGGTSSAAMRSDTMVPGAAVTHLRVRGSLDSFAPLR